jgi:non-ribosomal peptide synthetase component E (peptide arylation enzyme)
MCNGLRVKIFYKLFLSNYNARKITALQQAARRLFLRIKKSPDQLRSGLFIINFGGDLLSHTGPRAVPSALKSLTSVFGMGTGVASSL